MQNREEELNKLYEILDKEDAEIKIENKYIESVKRRLNREYLMSSSQGIAYRTVTKVLSKPKVKIVLRKKDEGRTRERGEEERSEECKKQVEEDLFDIEKPSEEEMKKIIGKEWRETEKTEGEIKTTATEEKKAIPKDEFIEIVSRVRGVGKRKAEKLYRSGFDSFEKILQSDTKGIVKKVRGIDEKTAERLKREITDILPKVEEEFDQMYILKENKKEEREIEKSISKSKIGFIEEIPEWVTIEKSPVDEEPQEWKKMERDEPYRYEEYTLYRIEKRGKIKYVFSKKPVKDGEPCKIPKGYVVRVKKGKPLLEKVK